MGGHVDCMLLIGLSVLARVGQIFNKARDKHDKLYQLLKGYARKDEVFTISITKLQSTGIDSRAAAWVKFVSKSRIH